jgi:hypothetical protein
MNPQELLDSFIKEAPPQKRQEMLQRFFDCVAEILHDYLATFDSPFDALQAAVSEWAASLFGSMCPRKSEGGAENSLEASKALFRPHLCLTCC